jgi:arsenite-transporting ATPase
MQRNAMESMPQNLKTLKTFTIPLRSYNIMGLDKIRSFLNSDVYSNVKANNKPFNLKDIDELIHHIFTTGKKVIFTMGKGGVGKTTIAAAIALGLAEKGVKVHLTSTDPANHLKYVFNKADNITLSKIEARIIEISK